MSLDVMSLLEKLNRDYINKEVLAKHDMARGSFRTPMIVVNDYHEFNFILTSYIQHHYEAIGQSPPPTDAAFGEAKRILLKVYNKDRFQDGYAQALQMAKDGSMGGMRGILNDIADEIKGRAYNDYVDAVFHHYVDVLSKKMNKELAHAFFAHFQPTLSRFGYEFDETSFVHDPRAAVEYYLDVIQNIIRVGKKI